ncbi:hypothetical protein AAEO50_12300 [Rossellomorea oryzaecorticis]|uniref:Uncharacterized protein n=1 Tax=Rossellomorea oryzaecorticis TaxID=1396505 RepID=A0ABU9KBP4_9BACI
MPGVSDLKKDKEVQKKIKKELRRLNNIFKDIEQGKKDTVRSLIENAAFMSVILDELQQHIAENGTVSEYQNGANQWGTKISPEAQIYNSMIKNHMAIVKQLTDLLKDDDKDEDDDELMKFIHNR